jgi:hypothetical protein
VKSKALHLVAVGLIASVILANQQLTDFKIKLVGGKLWIPSSPSKGLIAGGKSKWQRIGELYKMEKLQKNFYGSLNHG